ncbi:MAG: TlpA family protein disulfide reductase [Actinomycetota bacterium]|nr:TlpA family protein disulfide reductase [Actinomycetota bacterium]
MRRLATFMTIAATLVLGACGDADRATQSDPASNTTAGAAAHAIDLPGGPSKALAANAAQANEIVGEGVKDLSTRLADLRGHPVVVNQWGSWCPPCRAEFPYFAQIAAKYQDRVAFVGLDANDARDAAQQFLGEVPPGFPSIFDPDSAATRSLGGGRISPTTFFLNTSGKRVDVRLGAYANVGELEQDVRDLISNR